MRKIFVLILSFIILFNIHIKSEAKSSLKKTNEINIIKTKTKLDETAKLYHELGLEDEIDYKTFYYAIKGFDSVINKKRKDIITIVDFSKPSLEKRGYVIDLKNRKILYSTYVMHGKNSGDNYTDSFSNIINSFQSSPGFYLTENSYIGQYGYSLRLNGLEKGINDKAKERAIVMHGSKYAKPIKGAPMLSKTLGCPAVPLELVKPIIDNIKNGSILYIHTNQKKYIEKSVILKNI
ncbi:murein L,D-transpeptidase catalytic domain family protein [Cetobacterium sp.]|uniref:murein L,D-transpeptidase catalytic domain family protein n=1 Tax=Cetobacterium sp. TaxID=2071632 RepID=UPI003F3B8B17